MVHLVCMVSAALWQVRLWFVVLAGFRLAPQARTLGRGGTVLPRCFVDLSANDYLNTLHAT
jgi:hypothetical protein